VEAVVRLADDPELRRKLGKRGHHEVTARYNRTSLAHQYLGVIEEFATQSQDG